MGAPNVSLNNVPSPIRAQTPPLGPESASVRGQRSSLKTWTATSPSKSSLWRPLLSGQEPFHSPVADNSEQALESLLQKSRGPMPTAGRGGHKTALSPSACFPSLSLRPGSLAPAPASFRSCGVSQGGGGAELSKDKPLRLVMGTQCNTQVMYNAQV